MRQILFWGALPFVIPQALHVRKTALRFARAAGPREGSVGEGQSFRLLGVGDSIIAGVGVAQLPNALVGQTATALAETLHARVHWTAHGLIGATSQVVLERVIPKLPADPADFVILSVGVNDITGLRTHAAWTATLENLLRQLHQHSPDATIAMVGIPPLHRFPLLPQPLRALFGFRGRSFDAAARDIIARQYYAVHLPLDFDPQPSAFSADGYHPSEASYQEFGRIAATRLAENRLTL